MTRRVVNAIYRAEDAVLDWLHYVPIIVLSALVGAGIIILWLQGVF